MLFSVIIPTYNRRNLVEQTLESVWAQMFTDFEVIVVDDGSTDGTTDWLASQGSRIHLLKQANQGPSAARNLGASQASGEYLAFLDSDDLWFPWTLETYAEAVSQHGKATMLRACWMEFSESTLRPPAVRDAMKSTLYQDYLKAGDGGIFLGAGLIAVRRDAFLQAGGFDTGLYCAEEHDLGLKMGVMPGFIEVRAPCQVAYRRHAVSATQDINKMIHGSRMLVMREKMGAFPGGDERRSERRSVITFITRPVSLVCLRISRPRDAWALFISTLLWSLLQGRWRYFLGFPALALLWCMRPARGVS